MEDGEKLMTGVVRKWDETRGYGFIRVEGITEDIFVHHESIKMQGYRFLSIGDTVQFRISRDTKGWKARDVVKISSAQTSQAQPTES